mgnify:CR=1 FL=1|tara:strand:- start:103 stop:465 length:363 start_codon:yes stop_codon:yes gene_type:complete
MQTLLKINSLELYAYHGWFEQEQRIGAKYKVNLEVALKNASFNNDALSETVDYEQLIAVIKDEMAQKSKTIERVGERIVRKVMELSDLIESVKLEIFKLNPPVGELMDSFSVVFYEEQKK